MFTNFTEHKTDKRKFGEIWSSICGSVVAMFALELLLSIITLLIAVAITKEEQPNIPMMISLYTTFGGIVATVWMTKKQKWQNSDIGVLFNKKTFFEYLCGALLGLLMLLLSVLPAFLLKQATFSFAALTSSGWGMWILYGLGFIIQSFSEEHLCRGFIMKRLTQRYNVWWTLFWQAIIFMLLHSGNPGMGLIPYLNLFLMGVVFGQLVIITDNLMLASGLHWLWNFSQGCILGIKVSGLEGMTTILNCEMNGSHLLTGGDFGIEGALSTSIVTLIVIGVLLPKMLSVIKNKALPLPQTDANSGGTMV